MVSLSTTGHCAESATCVRPAGGDNDPPVVRAIKHHNHLNGVLFSVLGVSARLRRGWRLCCGVRDTPQLALRVIAMGIAINCLCIVGFGAASWMRGERGAKLSMMLNREYRATVHNEYPNLNRETVLICVGVVVPYSLATVGAVDIARGST